jgi:hypothetical protein
LPGAAACWAAARCSRSSRVHHPAHTQSEQLQLKKHNQLPLRQSQNSIVPGPVVAPQQGSVRDEGHEREELTAHGPACETSDGGGQASPPTDPASMVASAPASLLASDLASRGASVPASAGIPSALLAVHPMVAQASARTQEHPPANLLTERPPMARVHLGAVACQRLGGPQPRNYRPDGRRPYTHCDAHHCRGIEKGGAVSGSEGDRRPQPVLPWLVRAEAKALIRYVLAQTAH